MSRKLFIRLMFIKNNIKPRQLVTVDTLVPRSMKSAANCDKSCELQNSVNHRTLERKLHLGVELKCVCSSVGNKYSLFKE
jgi:hypothetical protein